MEKSNKSNNYEMKLKRFDPRFRDDKELNVFANLLPGITNTFGNFWFDVQKSNLSFSAEKCSEVMNKRLIFFSNL